jgi:two-component system LytT family response regulator/two-component system response regulator LytT
MSVIRILIAEDEAPALNRLKRQLSQCSDIDIIGQAETGPEAIQLANELKPDLLLMDIQMPGVNGLNVIKELKGRCLVIFTTAYNQYAVDAFEQAAVDYLLKPYDLTRLQLALERAKERLIERNERQKHSYIKAVTGQRSQYLALTEITHFHVSAGTTWVHCSNKTYLIDQSLSCLEKTLPPFFVRVHRNAVVNSHKIKETQRQLNGTLKLSLSGVDAWLTTSRNGARKLKTYLDNLSTV